IMSSEENPSGQIYLGLVSRSLVKEQVKVVIDDLEMVLGELKDVAKELKEVVSQIDTLTGSLNLDEETDESKCSTLTSSSSGATGSSGGATVHRLSRFSTTVSAFSSSSCSSSSSTVLTVLRRAKPPVPPPRTTPVSVSSLSSSSSSSSYRGKCPAASKERVRFSDMVQYHGFVYDSDRSEHRVQQRMRVQETRSVAAAVQHRHQCPGGVVDDAKPPPKAILRKSRNTTV
uniref:Proline rich 16 n=1 Tax=Petromyzon marinus TaxID=7757 RepID=S4RZY3_PETMA